MTHDEAVLRFPDFLDGHLPEAERTRVQGHVDGCEDCRALAEGYRVIVGALRPDGAVDRTGHPGSDALVAFATGLGTLDPADHMRVARHLATCAACAADVDATCEAERQLTTPRAESTAETPRATRARWRGWALAAAVAGGMVLGYPLYRMTGGPRVAEAPVPAAWSGAIGLPVVSSALRGGTPSETSIDAPEGRPFVAFALALPPELSMPARTPLTFSLVAASGERVWRQETDSSRVAALAGRSGAVLLVVPSSVVAPGRYVVRLAPTGAASEAPVVEAPLRITR